jgi:GTP-binding protein
VIGENIRDDDLLVNAQRAKQLTNIRAAGSDRKANLAPPVKLPLEELLEHIAADECVEVTPKSLRLRKLLLDEHARRHTAKKRKLSEADVQ